MYPTLIELSTLCMDAACVPVCAFVNASVRAYVCLGSVCAFTLALNFKRQKKSHRE